MKTVLVTGGAGFIGSHVVDRLLTAGHRVAVADNLSTGRRTNLAPLAELYVVDVTQPDIHEVVDEVRPDVIVHLAAQVSVAASVCDPVFDTAVNVLGTVNVLEAARKCGVMNVVFASSAAVYGTPRSLPLAEDAPISPLSPYGLAKASAEKYLAQYSSLFGMRVAITRYSNVYGPRQLPDGDGGVVAKFIHEMSAGRSPVFHGDGGQSRDFVYVKDVADANYLALQYVCRGAEPTVDVFNVSTGEQVTLVNLYATLKGLLPQAANPVFVAPREGDIRHSCLDCRKALDRLGWVATVSLEEGLQETVRTAATSISVANRPGSSA